MNDTVRAAIIGLFQSLFPLLLVLGVLDWSEVEIGAAMLFITNAITLIALLFKTGQQPSDSTNAVSITAESKPVGKIGKPGKNKK